MKKNRLLPIVISVGLLFGLAAGFLLLTGFTADNPHAPNDSRGCLQCHRGIESMHSDGDHEIGITCVDCHGGNGAATTKERAHVQPRLTEVFQSSANPKHSYAALNHESPDFIRFMNPGDFRVADQTCGKCHANIFSRMLTSIMAHSALMPQASLYNNGIHDGKKPVFGEAYMPDGTPATLAPQQEVPLKSHEAMDRIRNSSLVKKLFPLPRFEIIAATDPFRVLERGNNDAGTRARGTDFRISGGGIMLHKTRLNDPTLWFLGTNETGGNYRSSGCTACHVLYANDRELANNSPEVVEFYRNGGKPGHSASKDPTIPKNEPGHPVAHRLTLSVPVSQCLTCHYHQGNGALGTYLGAMWWDQETDADKILSPGAKRDEQISEAKRQQLYLENHTYKDAQIADWHGHSWNFRKVYKMDRYGNLLDAKGNKVANEDPKRFEKAVLLQDIHMERGLHCIDCHTEQDVHGDGRLWGTMVDPIEIQCQDCHGSATQRARLITSGLNGGRNLADRRTGARTPFGQRQFQVDENKIIQRSKINKNLQWVVPQLVDIHNPASPDYNAKAARAHTLQRDGVTWGKPIGAQL
ncbi:MAG: NapC/NirT family cytochrome c [candidate division KSB1 bacterium]|nr:NapC/NirT family cytochrome c [candidate division KSB1 bacterium]